MGDEDSKAEAEESQEAPAPNQGTRQTEATLWGAARLTDATPAPTWRGCPRCPTDASPDRGPAGGDGGELSVEGG